MDTDRDPTTKTKLLERLGRASVLLLLFGLASAFALRFGTGGLWKGLDVAQAVAAREKAPQKYDLTKLSAVNRTLKKIVEKYVEPDRVNPRQMFLGALNQVQKEVAQVIVTHEEKSPTVRVRVDDLAQDFRVDNVQGPWDVAARLREVFVFLQQNLKDSTVDLAEIEYAACNGMLRTLDPHSVFMSPEAFEEMNLSTAGHFGGLGIVIAIRDDLLTVMRPMPDTPAGRAGLKRLDRITKINNESTLNMPLDDAVNRLRGEPGSRVTIWVQRDGKDGWQPAKPVELTREVIRIRSVESRLLAPGIGYISLRQFQANTYEELDNELRALHAKERLSGLVLDLRNDPGGLLDQAARVADRFLTQGSIVATVGQSEGRDEKRASAAGTEPNYPMVVLVNGQSASASEIVAGALKNNDRAIIVGQTTFGKGSVQLVFQNLTPEKAALKLTIAQYLTPGDVSIQGVGVTPDIELDPMTVDPLEMDLIASESSLRERDLDKSLDSKAKRNRDRPFFTLGYNFPQEERLALRELGGQDEEFKRDFYVRFAQELVASLKPGKRSEQLAAARQLLTQVEKREMSAVAQDLKRLGVDWQKPPEARSKGPAMGDYEVKLETVPKGGRVRAGDPMTLKVSVKNKSNEPIYQLRAITKSDGAYYDERELIFGKVGPKETRQAEIPLGFCDIEGRKFGSSEPLPADARRVCVLPKDAVTRQDVVSVRFSAEGGDAPSPVEFRPTVESLPRPIFAYTFQVADNRPGNGDGQLAKGEGATLYLTVKNVGKGTALETKAGIRNLTGNGLLLRAGRFDLAQMKPGESKQVAFTFDVLRDLAGDEAKMELIVEDRDLRVVSNEKVTIPIVQSPIQLETRAGFLKVPNGAEVRGEPVPGVRPFGTLKGGSLVERLGASGGFTKIRLEGDRFGFVPTQDVTEVGAGPVKPVFEWQLTRSPPLLDVKTADLASRDGTVRIEGRATDGDGLLDAYAFVGTNKVFYLSNRRGKDPTGLSFAFDAPLEPGINVINVVARENQDTATRHTLVIRRDGPSGEALPTSKRSLWGADWDFSGGDDL